MTAHPSTRPSADPDNSYAPMLRRPTRLECGSPVHYGHLHPPCCLVGWLLHESRMEAHEHINVHAVPMHTEPIPRDLSDPDGPQIMVTDSGALGGRPWSSPMSRRMDISYFEGETIQSDQSDTPLENAIRGLRRYCSGKHAEWSEHRGEPVCWSLVRLIIMGRYDVATAADRADLTPERAAWLLHRTEPRKDGRVIWQGAADKLWTWVANDVNGISLRHRRDPAA